MSEAVIHITDEDNLGRTLTWRMTDFFSGIVDEFTLETPDHTLQIAGWVEDGRRIMRLVDRG